MRHLGHRPELDGLRGVAILLVVAHHAGLRVHALHGWFRGGALGVDLFFVLSGFLITSLILTEWAERGTISLRAFYARRARRLLPAVVTLVFLAWLLGVISTPEHTGRLSFLALARLSYFGNYLIAFGPGVGSAFVHLWSLAQEEQFYLFWPPLLVLLLRRRIAPDRLLLLLAMLIVAVNVDRSFLVLHGAGGQRLWYAPDSQGDAILFGCAAAVAWSHRLWQPPRGTLPAALAAAGSVLVLFRGTNPVDYLFPMPLFLVACTIALLAILESPTSLPSRALSLLPLRQVGKVSYGIYLWHATMLVLFGLIGLPVSIGAALLSYRYIERPFLRLHRVPRRATSYSADTAPAGGIAAS